MAIAHSEPCLAHLAARSAAALAALAASLEGLENLLERVAEAPAGTQGIGESQALVAEVIGMLGRDAPPLLLRAQALRMRLHLAGLVPPDGLGSQLGALQEEMDRLIGIELPGRRSEMTAWLLPLRQGRGHAMRLAAEFLHHARTLAAQP